MSERPVMGRCPRCGHEVMQREWLCPACEYVLDTSFLGRTITNEAPPPLTPPDPNAHVTFFVGGPRPAPPKFRRARAMAPVETVLEGGLPAVFVQQLMRFSISQRHLESPMNVFLLEVWTSFLRGRPALLVLPSLVNNTIEGRPPREPKALATMTEGLRRALRSFETKECPGAVVATGDGRLGFAQPLVPGVRLREVLKASKAEGTTLPETVVVACVAAVEDVYRTLKAPSNPAGAPRDLFLGFDGAVGVARGVAPMVRDSAFSSWTSDQLAPSGARGLKGFFVGAEDSASAEVQALFALEGGEFREAIVALAATRAEEAKELIAGVARGVFPDRFEASEEARARCEDQLLEPLVFPDVGGLPSALRPWPEDGVSR